MARPIQPPDQIGSGSAVSGRVRRRPHAHRAFCVIAVRRLRGRQENFAEAPDDGMNRVADHRNDDDAAQRPGGVVVATSENRFLLRPGVPGHPRRQTRFDTGVLDANGALCWQAWSDGGIHSIILDRRRDGRRGDFLDVSAHGCRSFPDCSQSRRILACFAEVIPLDGLAVAANAARPRQRYLLPGPSAEVHGLGRPGRGSEQKEALRE